MIQQNSTSGKNNAWLVRIALFLTAVLFIPGLIQFRDALTAAGYLDLSPKWRLGINALLAAGIIELGIAILSLTPPGRIILRAISSAGALFRGLKKLNIVLFLAAVFIFPYLLIVQYANLTSGFFTRVFILWMLALVGFGCLRALWPARAWHYPALASLLAISAAFQIAFFFTNVSDYPLTLTWSETSNYFYSSLFLAPKIYGFATPLPLFNPARALLGVFPFLLPQPQIWVSRLWVAILWAVCTALAAWLSARRLHLGDRLATFLLAGWAFFFILQGPIYYELLLSAAVVLAWFDPRRLGRSLLVVGAASIWAGLCRVNWYPMPGMLAVLLYLLEVPRQNASWRSYFLKPALWAAAGTALAVAAFAGYTALSGNSTSNTATALQSPLLWSRLLPGANSPLGVLPNALLVAIPALVLIGLWLARQGKQWDGLRRLGILAILAIFFAGGLVVSVKIGGGSNIHDLDGFWFLLMVAASSIFFGRALPDRPTESSLFRVPPLLAAAGVILPLALSLSQALPPPLPDRQEVNHVINQINYYVSEAVHSGKEVLFIDNKQLITFGYVPSAKMVPEYESAYILEMAMIGQQDYFEKFTQDLKSKRFGVIIANPQPTRIQGPGESFAEENNAQIKWVGGPLLCYYQNLKTWLDVSVSILVPEPVPCK